MALPYIIDRGLADALSGGQGTAAPVRHSLGLAAQSRIDDRMDLFRPVSRLAASSGSHLPQAPRAVLMKTSPPKHHRFAIGLQLRGDLVVGQPFGGCQHDTAAKSDLLRSSESGSPFAQLPLVGFLQ